MQEVNTCFLFAIGLIAVRERMGIGRQGHLPRNGVSPLKGDQYKRSNWSVIARSTATKQSQRDIGDTGEIAALPSSGLRTGPLVARNASWAAGSPFDTAQGRPMGMKVPLLCKEGSGEVEGVSRYPTQPPLTKGRGDFRSNDDVTVFVACAIVGRALEVAGGWGCYPPVGRSTCPPNFCRIADSNFSANVCSCRDRKRA